MNDGMTAHLRQLMYAANAAVRGYSSNLRPADDPEFRRLLRAADDARNKYENATVHTRYRCVHCGSAALGGLE